MRPVSKAFYTWIVLEVGYLFSLLLPHSPVPFASFLTYSIQTLALVICVFIARYEPVKKNRLIFINFSLFFFISVLGHIYHFIGTLLFPDPDDALWMKFFFSQYISYGAYFFFLSLALVYLTVDVLFRDFATFYKYLIAIGIAGGFFAYYYSPMFQDPLYLHHTADVNDYRDIRDARDKFIKEKNYEPSAIELSAATTLHAWRDGQKVGVLYPDETARRVEQLYPYLQEENWKILVFRPLYVNMIHMSVVCLGFILLFFGYLYMKDPPQGAYIEKIVFLFLISSSLEIFHAWSAIKALEFQTLAQVWEMGQYLSVAVMFMIAMGFATRLHFITSAKGEFYESELAASPAAITRWRDMLDNIVIEKFFNRKLVLGRMFVDPSHQAKVQH